MAKNKNEQKTEQVTESVTSGTSVQAESNPAPSPAPAPTAVAPQTAPATPEVLAPSSSPSSADQKAEDADPFWTAPVVAAPKTKQIAKRDIVHDGKTIRKGQEIPKEFPQDSWDLLVKSGDIVTVLA